MSEVNEHPEYNRDTNPYPSFGKKYNSERAIISLTSWKARINTVSKTLFSLLKQCPGFHIVLVLSEEEFPKMMDELPENLKLFIDNELIEILWVYKNYKSFKKVLFTMDKYRDVPVISADDDCIYTCNYAQELYDKWKETTHPVITYNKTEQNIKYYTEGPCTFFDSKQLENFKKLSFSKFSSISNTEDDSLYGKVLECMKLEPKYVKSDPWYKPFKFHTIENAIHGFYFCNKHWRNLVL